MPQKEKKRKTDDQPLGVCEQGTCWPYEAIRAHGCLQIFDVRFARRCDCAYPVLVMATPVPGHPTEIYQLTGHAQRSYNGTACKWDQLRELVHRWVYLPYVFHLFMPSILFLFLFFFFSLFSFLFYSVGRVGSQRNAALSGRCLEEVWRKSGGSLEECWTDSYASPALWAIIDELAQTPRRH